MHGSSSEERGLGRTHHLRVLQQWLAAGAATTVWLAAAYLGLTRNDPASFIAYSVLGGGLAWLARRSDGGGLRALPLLLGLCMIYAISTYITFGYGSLGYLVLLPCLASVLLFQPEGTHGRQRLAGFLITLILIGVSLDYIGARDQADSGAIILHVVATGALTWSIGAVAARMIADLETRLENSAESREEHARADRLTSLSNRVFLQMQLDAEVARAKRSEESLSIVLVDIDGLGKINDTYGHEVGDNVLRTVATTLQRALRPYDHVGRWDGEEFLLVMPRTTAVIAGTVCQRLRMLLEHAMAGGSSSVPPFTVTFGVASVEVEAGSGQAVKWAEAAVRFAKQEGPGKVAVQTDDGPQISTQL